MVSILYDKGKMDAAGNALKALKERIAQKTYEAVFDSTLDVLATVVKPGYAPYRTGNLRRSFTNKVERTDGMITGAVGTNLIYARIHEFGGQTGRGHAVTIKPQLYLTRASQDNKRQITERFKRYLAVDKLTR